MAGFVRRLLGREEEGPVYPQPHIPSGRRVYCVGDIHGRYDLLQQMHALIEEDARDYEGAGVLVYLGDFIDRGEQSRQVVDLLMEAPPAGLDRVCLLGNHEQTMLDFLQHPKAAAGWLMYGGREMLRSYGVEPGGITETRDVLELRDELEQALPRSHMEFFRACRLLHLEGSYCFVHAGIRPGVPVQEQRDEDLMWIRDEFLRSRDVHEYIVVHGHTISDEVEFLPNRIGIDTGAYFSGVLSCLVLEGGEQRLLQTGGLRS